MDGLTTILSLIEWIKALPDPVRKTIVFFAVLGFIYLLLKIAWKLKPLILIVLLLLIVPKLLKGKLNLTLLFLPPFLDVVITARIPRDLKRKLRRRAILEDKTMTELIIQALTSFLDGNGSYEKGPYIGSKYYDKRIEELASEVERLKALLGSHGVIREQGTPKDPIPADGSSAIEPELDEEPVQVEIPKGIGGMEELLDNPWASILVRKGRDKSG